MLAGSRSLNHDSAVAPKKMSLVPDKARQVPAQSARPKVAFLVLLSESQSRLDREERSGTSIPQVIPAFADPSPKRRPPGQSVAAHARREDPPRETRATARPVPPVGHARAPRLRDDEGRAARLDSGARVGAPQGTRVTDGTLMPTGNLRGSGKESQDGLDDPRDSNHTHSENRRGAQFAGNHLRYRRP